MINYIKKLFRPIYYLIYHNKIVSIDSPNVMAGLKWIIDRRFDRAYYKGYYEPKIVQFLADNVKDGDCFLDVGAHAGYFSCLFSRLSPSGTVISFEPDFDNVAYVKKIVAINSINNIELIPKALSSKTEKLSFVLGATSSTGKVSKSGKLEIDGVAMDEILLNRDLPNTVYIKIDVEGFGGNVIQGALKTISKYNPIILMEIHNDSDERSSLSILSKFNYNFYNLDLCPEDANNLSTRFFIAKNLGLMVR